jgi:AcrR family transcriptional regulator
LPRPYALGKRTEPKNETRARIVAAAARVYGQRGVGAASNLAIAREADVAPATVRNHFPDPRLLANAVFDELLAELRPPTPAIFEGVAGIRDRVTRLALELAAFYERSSSAWALYRQQPDIVEAWAGGVDRYYADIEALMRLSLGPLETDETALALVAAVIGPPTFFALRARGLSAEEAAELCVAVTVPWLETRAAANRR